MLPVITVQSYTTTSFFVNIESALVSRLRPPRDPCRPFVEAAAGAVQALGQEYAGTIERFRRLQSNPFLEELEWCEPLIREPLR